MDRIVGLLGGEKTRTRLQLSLKNRLRLGALALGAANYGLIFNRFVTMGLCRRQHRKGVPVAVCQRAGSLFGRQA